MDSPQDALPQSPEVERLLPCPFCGSAAGYGRSDDGGWYVECSWGPCNAATNLRYTAKEDGRARVREQWNRRLLPDDGGPSAYDAGLLSDFGGGDVDWWQDYIRAELDSAHEFYVSQWPALSTPPAQSGDDWFAGDVDADGNKLVTIRADELQRLRDEREKFMWQVRDTCARAEKAEAALAALTPDTSKEGADVREAREPDWVNAETCIENARIAYDNALEADLWEDDNPVPIDTVVDAGDLGVLIDLAAHAVALRASQPPEQVGMVLDAQRQTIEACARVAEAYLARMSAIVTRTEGDDDGASSACWHARQIADNIRALRPNASLADPKSTAAQAGTEK